MKHHKTHPDARPTHHKPACRQTAKPDVAPSYSPNDTGLAPLTKDNLYSYTDKIHSWLTKKGFSDTVAWKAAEYSEQAAFRALANGTVQNWKNPQGYLRQTGLRAAVRAKEKEVLCLPLEDDRVASRAGVAGGDREAEEAMALDVREAVLALPAHGREAITLVYFCGLSQRAAAREMGMPYAGFRRLFKEAMDALECALSRPPLGPPLPPPVIQPVVQPVGGLGKSSAHLRLFTGEGREVSPKEAGPNHP